MFICVPFVKASSKIFSNIVWWVSKNQINRIVFY